MHNWIFGVVKHVTYMTIQFVGAMHNWIIGDVIHRHDKTTHITEPCKQEETSYNLNVSLPFPHSVIFNGIELTSYHSGVQFHSIPKKEKKRKNNKNRFLLN